LLRDQLSYNSPWPLEPGHGAESVPWHTAVERHFIDGREIT
jgi:hypothetical protein